MTLVVGHDLRRPKERLGEVVAHARHLLARAARTHDALIADETLSTSVSYVDAAEVDVRFARA